MMQEAKPRTPQARAISHIVRWFEATLPRESESREDYLERRHRQQERIQKVVHRNIERSAEYETERDFTLFLIEGYVSARREEIKQHPVTPSPDILQGLAEELKGMKALTKGNSAVIFTSPVTENPST